MIFLLSAGTRGAAEPSHRLLVKNDSGWLEPALQLPGMVIWGITGELLDAVLRMGAWELR
jgi:hypothetical protein